MNLLSFIFYRNLSRLLGKAIVAIVLLTILGNILHINLLNIVWNIIRTLVNLN